MDGVQEAVATKVRVFRKNGSTLTFGVYNGRFDAVMDGDDAPLLTLQTGRNIGQSGSAVFAIPGLSKHEVGPHWVELISLGDFVEIESTVQRAPGSQKNADGYSHKWRGIFTGRVADIEEEDVPDGDGFALITTIICEDFLGTLDTPQFSYWRKLGATFGAQGNLREKLERLDRLDLGEKEITANSIAVSAQILLESFIEGRIDIRRKIDGKDRDQKDTYGYRFESDDLRMGNLSLETLAPEGQSWKAAFEEVVDGPVFYEMFQDSLPGGSSKTLSPIKEGKSDGVARGRPGPESRRTRALEASVSTSSSGPAPFPTYRG